MTVASGERNSWLALATKSARIRSARRSAVTSWNTSTAPAGASSPRDASTASGATMTSNVRTEGASRVISTVWVAPPAKTVSTASSAAGCRTDNASARPG